MAEVDRLRSMNSRLKSLDGNGNPARGPARASAGSRRPKRRRPSGSTFSWTGNSTG
jgi:hypothetical protein